MDVCGRLLGDGRLRGGRGNVTSSGSVKEAMLRLTTATCQRCFGFPSGARNSLPLSSNQVRSMTPSAPSAKRIQTDRSGLRGDCLRSKHYTRLALFFTAGNLRQERRGRPRLRELRRAGRPRDARAACGRDGSPRLPSPLGPRDAKAPPYGTTSPQFGAAAASPSPAAHSIVSPTQAWNISWSQTSSRWPIAL